MQYLPLNITTHRYVENNNPLSLLQLRVRRLGNVKIPLADAYDNPVRSPKFGPQITVGAVFDLQISISPRLVLGHAAITTSHELDL